MEGFKISTRRDPVSFDKKEDNLQWIWIWMGFIILIAGCVLFTMYGHYLGPISREHAAWSSFGSLLSGFFTLTGTVATLATLLFLSKQNKDQQKVTQAQLDTLTFERYINHRKLFTENLNELVATNKNAFTFRDPSHLYNSIFSENSPHHCVFSVPPTYDENGDGTNHVGLLYRKLAKVKSTLDLVQPTDEDVEGLVHDLIDLSYDLLMIEPVGNPRTGDILFMETRYGFNIFALKEFIDPALKIANMIFKFTNNPPVDGQMFQGNSYFILEAMLKTFIPTRKKSSLNIHNSVVGLDRLVAVYLIAQMLYEGNQYLFPHTVNLLRQKLFSVGAVNELAMNEKFDDVLNVCWNEVAQRILSMTDQDEHYSEAIEIDRQLTYLASRNG